MERIKKNVFKIIAVIIALIDRYSNWNWHGSLMV
jgi:hypothetical protein